VTLGSVITGAIAIYTALRSSNKRLGAEIFLRYSDRLSALRLNIPTEVFFDRLSPMARELTLEERRSTHQAIYSIFELYALRRHGFVPATIWQIWEPDIERLLSSPTFLTEFKTMRIEFERHHPDFSRWVAELQSKPRRLRLEN
jgi:mannosyltransferase OCH1-like enzyme